MLSGILAHHSIQILKDNIRTPIGDENETEKVTFLVTSYKAENLKIISVKREVGCSGGIVITIDYCKRKMYISNQNNTKLT